MTDNIHSPLVSSLHTLNFANLFLGSSLSMKSLNLVHTQHRRNMLTESSSQRLTERSVAHVIIPLCLTTPPLNKTLHAFNSII